MFHFADGTDPIVIQPKPSPDQPHQNTSPDSLFEDLFAANYDAMSSVTKQYAKQNGDEYDDDMVDTICQISLNKRGDGSLVSGTVFFPNK